MTAHLKKYRIAILLIILFFSAYVAIEYVAAKKVAHLRIQMEQSIEDQKINMTNLSEISSRSGSDAVTEATVTDCSVDERNQFDVLLGRLDQGLPQTELSKLDRLFGRCGYFFAERKSIMVARLSREVEVYETLVTQLEAITSASVYEDYNVGTWKELALEEKTQSALFLNLVRTQDRIISTLLSGKSADSVEIKTILSEVKETQETLAISSKQTADLRASLLSE